MWCVPPKSVVHTVALEEKLVHIIWLSIPICIVYVRAMLDSRMERLHYYAASNDQLIYERDSSRAKKHQVVE